MSVYDRSYKGYSGRLTPGWSRWTVFARYALEEVFRSRIFVGFFVVCFVPPLIAAVMIYLRYNVEALTILDLSMLDLIRIDASFFRNFIYGPQSSLAFVLVLIVGPALISPDLRNNALPLVLSRPLSKTDYVVGKLTVLVGLASLVTWIPALALFFLQSYLAGREWFLENLHLALAIPLSFGIWIVVLSVFALAISAWVKWKPWARIAFLGSIFVATALGQIFKVLYDTWWGSLIVLNDLMMRLTASLFGVESSVEIPLFMACASLLGFTAVSLLVLYWRIRAFEVIS
jgi:ABC-2 type transport system permease protein